jgi:hypothetical protein
LSSISVPPRFDKDRLAEFLIKKHMKRIESDKELSDAIHELEKRVEESNHAA